MSFISIASRSGLSGDGTRASRPSAKRPSPASADWDIPADLPNAAIGEIMGVEIGRGRTALPGFSGLWEREGAPRGLRPVPVPDDAGEGRPVAPGMAVWPYPPGAKLREGLP